MSPALKRLGTHELKFVAEASRNGDGVVLATGVFDIIHRDHVDMLETAALWGRLWVGLNSDRAVRELKGPGRPVYCEDDRAYVMAAFQCVDRVFIIDDVVVADAIHQVSPQIWVKGGGYTFKTLNQLEVAAAREAGTEIKILPMLEGYSTTKTLEKLKC